jgi:hypothetical protein
MIHKAKDLSPDQRVVIENLLGRSLAEDETISVRAVSPGSVPEWLRSSWESAERLGVSQLSVEEIDAEIMLHVKPGATARSLCSSDPGRSRC